MTENDRIQQLTEILKVDPANSLTRYALAMEYSKTGETEASLREFSALVEKSPDYSNGYFMAAQVLANNERKDEAKEWLKKGIDAARRTNNRHAENEMQAMLDELEY